MSALHPKRNVLTSASDAPPARRQRTPRTGAIEADDAPDSNPFAADDEPEAMSIATVPGLTLDDEGKLRARPAQVAVPGGYQLVDGMLLDVRPELLDEPEPETLWRQAELLITEADRPLDGEPALEVWYGSPEQPWTKTRLAIVREHGAWVSPAGWRRRLGAVAFDMSRYSTWKVHHKRGVEVAAPEPIGRWGPHDTVPDELQGVPPAVWLSLPGKDRVVRVRLGTADQEIDGLPVYVLTADQRRKLRELL